MDRSGASLRNKSSRDVVRLLRHFGFGLVRRGHHDIYEGYRNNKRRVVTVPRRKKSIAPKTLLSILTQAAITKDEARGFWT